MKKNRDHQIIKEKSSITHTIYFFPGKDKTKALALNALTVLQGKRQAKVYE